MDYNEQLSELDLHNQVKKIKSTLEYINVDIVNVTKRVREKLYKYQIPNLFEKLTLFEEGLKAIIARLKKIMDRVAKFENQLSLLNECDTSLCDSAYLERYQNIRKQIEEFKTDYKILKSKIILYTDRLE